MQSCSGAGLAKVPFASPGLLQMCHLHRRRRCWASAWSHADLQTMTGTPGKPLPCQPSSNGMRPWRVQGKAGWRWIEGGGVEERVAQCVGRPEEWVEHESGT